MDKHKAHWSRRHLSYGLLVGLCITSAVVTVLALRNNNLTALKLRDDLLQVDQQNGDTTAALNKLRTYIYGHMNTDLASGTSVYPPIQLKYTYERLQAEQKKRASDVNGQIYTAAQKYCEALIPTGLIRNRVPCIQQYLDSHPAAPQPAIPDSLYKFGFASPLWSPDIAGISLLILIISLVLLVIRIISDRWLAHRLRI